VRPKADDDGAVAGHRKLALPLLKTVNRVGTPRVRRLEGDDGVAVVGIEDANDHRFAIFGPLQCAEYDGALDVGIEKRARHWSLSIWPPDDGDLGLNPVRSRSGEQLSGGRRLSPRLKRELEMVRAAALRAGGGDRRPCVS
jgi:hypothetical protein